MNKYNIEIKNLRYEKPRNPWDVIVDRTSPVGNPFKLVSESDRPIVLEKYKLHFNTKVNMNGSFKFFIKGLISIYLEYHKLNLFCWCAPLPCHVETIVDFICLELDKMFTGFEPEGEGITHINIYSQSHTEMGQMLSNFYKCEMDTPFGKFMSVEGYWHWLSLEESPKKEVLKTLYGFKAREVGKQLRDELQQVKCEGFEEKIIKAIWQKLENNVGLFEPEYEHLPLRHYYNYSGKIIDITNKYAWLIEGLNEMRKLIYSTIKSSNLLSKSTVSKDTSINEDSVNVACFTGHRPDKLKGGYDYNSYDNIQLKEQIKAKCIQLILDKNVRVFICGGAIGIDQMAFQVVEGLKKDYPVFSVLAMPFEKQASKWPYASRSILIEQRTQCDVEVLVDLEEGYENDLVEAGDYHVAKMQKRNEYMVDQSDYVISVWDGTAGGTANCVKYAKKKLKPIININPNV